jgi:hypothetical protein
MCLVLRVVSAFRHEVAEYLALLGYYAASCGSFLPLLAS